MNLFLSLRQSGKCSAVRIFSHVLPLTAVLAIFPLVPRAVHAAEPAPASPRERLSFNNDWRFIKGDPTDAEGKLSYATLKPWLMATGPEFALLAPAPARPEGNIGGDVAYTQAAFDDTTWRKLNLPHDWGIEGPFNQDFPGESGKLPWWGVAWYRKHFTLPAGDQGKQISLAVDGAMAYASVWCNGQFVGGWPYGYSSWQLDLTPYVKAGQENVLAIRLDNPPESSRWYPGGGIYRNVWLIKTTPVHVAQWGTYITTPQITKQSARVHVEVTLDNNSKNDAEVNVLADFFELNGRGEKSGLPVASLKPTNVKVHAGTNAVASLDATINYPKFWTLDARSRYVAVVTVQNEGTVADVYETPFGIRTIKFTADHGFLLNGERVALNGVCDHHDLGALGSTLNVRALERQLEMLQEMGCNAIRTSHNPPAPELLDLCDRMGFVVMDEAFDCWLRGKKKNDYHLIFADWHEKDMRALVRRDRNHPCVILWSIGNEIAEQSHPAEHKVGAELAAIVHSEDPSRPVTSACNNAESGYNGFASLVDVFGYNYRPNQYGRFRTANPNKPLFASETASCVSSRGEYFFPVSDDKSQGRADFQVSSYDLYAPRWAMPPDTEFRGQDQYPFVAGEFVWTGFDYLGEPTPFNGDSKNMLNFTDPTERGRMETQLKQLGKILVPSRSSYFGIIDLAGFKKDRFYLYQAHWRPDLRMAHILPHWTWPERVGQVTPVMVYTSGDEAELFLNDQSLGRKKRGPYDYRLRWDNVVYHPGVLKVVTYRNHQRWASDSVQTAGPATRLLVSADHRTIKPDGLDLSYVTVTIADDSKRMVPRSHNKISFEVSGPAEVIATDNGDPTSFESFQAKERRARNGLCLAVVRSTGEPGQIVVTATSPGLRSAEVRLNAAKR